MSHRGSKAFSLSRWASDQRRIGYADGRLGRAAKFADQYYQRGYREGTERRLGVKR